MSGKTTGICGKPLIYHAICSKMMDLMARKARIWRKTFKNKHFCNDTKSLQNHWKNVIFFKGRTVESTETLAPPPCPFRNGAPRGSDRHSVIFRQSMRNLGNRYHEVKRVKTNIFSKPGNAESAAWILRRNTLARPVGVTGGSRQPTQRIVWKISIKIAWMG